ncbi:hypothetical protein ES708_10292 [subsurface metagenome]
MGGSLPSPKGVIRVIPAGRLKNGDFFISIALHLKRDTPSKWRDEPTYSEGVDNRIATGIITQTPSAGQTIEGNLNKNRTLCSQR